MFTSFDCFLKIQYVFFKIRQLPHPNSQLFGNETDKDSFNYTLYYLNIINQMKKTFTNILDQEEEEEQIRKIQRQEKASLKFSKQRFMRNGSPSPKSKTEEADPQRTALLNLIKKHLKVDILEKLSQLKVDLDEDKSIEWLNLSCYDHKDHDRINTDKDEEIWARCLLRLNGKTECVRGTVLGYVQEKNKYKFKYNIDGTYKGALVPRIFLCCDLEDPVRYCDRVAKAYFSRLYADNLIKFNYYVAKMPTEGLSVIDQTQRGRVKALTDQPSCDENSFQSLMEEAQSDYWKAMNGIILRKHLTQSRSQLVPTQLSVSLAKPKKTSSYYGLLQTGKELEMIIEENEKRVVKGRPFVQTFQDYCEKTILNEKNVVLALRQVKAECQKMAELQLCKTVRERKEPSRFEQFQTEQISYLQRSVNRLRNAWITTIREIMQASLKKGQSNWLTTSPDPSTYSQSKLKRYFMVVKFMMEDALRATARNSFNKLANFISDFIPQNVEVISIYQVNNYYSDGTVISPGVKNNSTHIPLFQTDLMRAFDDSGFNFATGINNFVGSIINIFNRMVEEVNKVPQVQQKVLLEIFKKQKQQRYLTAPNRNEVANGEIDQNQWLKTLYQVLKEQLERAIVPLSDYLGKFNELVDILKMRPDEIVKRVDQQDEQNPKDVNILKEDIENYYAKEKDILEKLPEAIHISFFKIYLKDVVEHLALKYHQTARGLEGIVAKKAKKSTTALLQKFKEMSKTVQQNPSNIEKLVQLRDYMSAIPSELQKIKKQIEDSNKIYDMLEQFRFLLGPDDLRKRFTVMVKPKSILDEVDKKKRELDLKKAELQQQLTSQQQEFKNNLQSLSRSIAQFHTYNKKDQHAEIAQKVQMINQALGSSLVEARKFNSRENLFQRDITDYSKVSDLSKDFLPYSNLWLTTTQWIKNIDNWMYGLWFEIDADQCEKFVEDSLKNLLYAIRYFKDKEIVHILKIAQSVKNHIDEFRPKVPLLMSLRKKGLRDRHWDQLSKKIGMQIRPSQDFTFARALSMGLMKNVQSCIDIAEQATKQFNIQNNLTEMIKCWQSVNFDFTTFKTGWIIKSFDDAVTLVDDHIASTQAMLFSPFKKPFEARIMEWFNTLKRISDILEEWAKLQMNWMYLQPIFDSPDIAKQLHKESKNFKFTDNFWRAIISRAKESPNVMKICQIEDLLDKIKESNNSLDLIQKSLNNYLESKRAKFARFYFLSNNQLLEILSQAKEPLAVQPYLKKVFENINEVQFNEKKQIITMLSAEQEKIHLDKPIDPKNKNVQDWMTELEEQMKLSVRSVLLYSITQYSVTKRQQWVLEHPGQCVLNGGQVQWTREVEESFEKKELKKYYEGLTHQLQGTVELVRKKLSKNQSITLNALIVIDVHARDVVENLYLNDIDDEHAFEWISQLRYYWQDDQCMTKCVQTVFPYGYEYLGNTLRLVITPLTDKCYMTLMGALKLNLGGAPAGPAGTGKTESTKDLAKALAKQCVVFNCSDSMDYIMIGKFFKGLASAGAWCCFDEFNRINIEVLSVIAQQLLILFGQKAKGSTQVDFEGSEIKLQPTFSVFITMNPGYAGRTQLPDNLKALFRPVAMMVPDYAMIGEIMLYSFGFKRGRQLAKKMVVTFRLASEQLSSQDHYDYGMRAVRSVINAAGILKEKDPDMNEDKLLLRALRDVNVPKFLKDDLPLFENIIMDLFPGVDKPVINYGELLQSIRRACQSPQLNLEPTEVFLAKALQLYDTIQVRHGLMLVGPAGGGKTETYSILRNALTSLQNQGYYKVNTHVVNPKSVTMGQLYGMFNEASREWMDGVLAYTVRKCCSDRTNQRHWIMFDGPVDALWIENMNTVLDDNKKLCLNSGQILTLTPYMTMMFEVEDLAVASPATVSRCGMVYIEPAALGVKPLYFKWFHKIPPKIQQSKKLITQLNDLMQSVAYPLIDFVRRNCKEIIPSINQNLIQSFFRNLDCYFFNYVDTEILIITAQDIQKLEEIFSNLFVFCLVWSLGATTDWDGRSKFNEQLKVLLSKKGLQLLPNFYDYFYNQKQKQYQFWVTLSSGFEIGLHQEYHEVIVPTAQSQRSTFLTKMLLSNDYHVLISGPTGTGKTINSSQLLTYNMGETYQYIPITFSAQTSANQTQDSIDSKLDKIKRGVFGAPVGKKYIVFVDDLNMPKKEEYGAQPPIELLRQFMDHKGWYNRKDQLFMRIQNILILTALGPPGGGRTSITPRLIRHFNMLNSNELDAKTISQIFTTISRHFLKKFPEEVLEIIPLLVQAVINVYDEIKINLLPTPNKSHYTFNLRDISKVFQGICAASSKYCGSRVTFLKLWSHEIERVFGDRLTCNEDRSYLRELTQKQIISLGSDSKEVLGEKIVFCDFWQGRESEPRLYMEVPNQNKLMEKIYEYQNEYNSDPRYSGARGKNSLKLVLFQDACEHISRIVRVLRQPRGNALLLGVGGSGRQSLAKISAFIANQSLTGIELIKNYGLKAWREDLKRILMTTGLDMKPTTFLFTETQIIHQQMLEDINSVLNSGDVTGLYPQKEFDEIINTCKGECLKKGLQPNKMNVFSQYLARLNQNIHIVLAMSPLGSAFSNRLRMFPSLVNCCTLDWFSEWPEEALVAVGRGQIRDFLCEHNLDKYQQAILQTFKTVHKSVEMMSTKYLSELRRHNYVTPMSYLELLTMFKLVSKEKQQELKNSINRLKSGLDKLIGANREVTEMQIQLKDLQPQLQKSAIETSELMIQIQVQKKEAEETERVVSKEQAEAKIQTEEAMQIAREVDIKVQDANAKLAESLKAVDKLKTENIVQIKSLKTPSKTALIVLGGCVIMFEDIIKSRGREIIMRKVEGSMKKEEDWMNTARIELLDNPKQFLQQLKGYDKQHINQALISKFNQKIRSEIDFNFQKAKSAGVCIEALYQWEMAMYIFNQIYINTQPLREKQAEVKQLVAEKTAMLQLKKKTLEGVINKIASLQKAFNDCILKKEELTKKILECQVKLDRAKKLTSGLSGEKDRWEQQVKRLQSLGKYLPGNSILSAAMVSYGGAFTSKYRQQLHQIWFEKIVQQGIEAQAKTSLVLFLGKPVSIQQWTVAGLPKDENSIQNGIIIEKGRRWPLMIDPQGQANKFIKTLGRESHMEGIDVVKEKEDTRLMKTLELAIQNGKWFLLENVGKELDQALQPILLQQIVKTSGSLSIALGDKTLAYNSSFKLFMTTTLPNPHYSPQTFVKVTVINFAITPQGLEDQMLAELVALENPQLQQKKRDIVRRNAADEKQLLNIQDNILMSLSQGNGGVAQLLLDETLINQLQNSKKFAQEINQRIQDSRITQQQIDKTREGYRSVAFRASILFFCIIDLSGIDPMYQYSLQWFINLFKLTVENALPAKQLQARLLNLINYFTYSLYENVCRSLFEKHKLLFSFMLAANIQFGKQELSQHLWRLFLAGPSSDPGHKPNPTKWISDSSWPDVYRHLVALQESVKLKDVYEDFMASPDKFKRVFDSQKPHEQELPSPWNTQLDEFEKLLVLKAIRMDKVTSGIESWISVKLGKQFIIPPTFDLPKCYKDSSNLTPLIFLLSPGSDPVTDFIKFAKEMDKKSQSISLGQGQGPKAQELVKSGELKGTWILLQNCHLAASWMSELQKVVEEFGDNTHKEFRLWLTSMPTGTFPISVLQNSVKMTIQPPQGLRANLLRSYAGITQSEFTECLKPTEYRKLLFGFCFFHAIIQDRRKFGPIGWNIAYEFTNEDLGVCKKQLRMLLDEYEIVPYKVLNYLGAEINYGGRVTDDKDVRLIKSILSKYVTSDIFKEDYYFSPSHIYYVPPAIELSDYINYIENLPLTPTPQAFGLHDNAEITTAQNQTLLLLESILSIQPRVNNSSGKNREEVIFEIVQGIQIRTPEVFDIEQIMKKYPTDYNQSMNTVLVQELVRYNRLLEIMKSSLISLKKALKGLVVMSEDLQKLSNSIFDNQVGKLWADKGFLSLKPLGSWIEDLISRVRFLNEWIKEGTPKIFWMSGFFFPQAFVTGSLQNYARKKTIAIDKISYKFSLLDHLNQPSDIKDKPQFGCYVYGLFLEGCCWSYLDHTLTDSKPKELFSQLPIMHLIPTEDKVEKGNIYQCPLYKVVSRSGTLSTTGHSTNFVMYIELPTKTKPQDWICSGVAAFLALRY